MIISASYKTDIPAFYGAWFRARREAGFCTVRNVWNNKDFTVSLRDEDCSAFVFWTRNARPFRDELRRTAQTHPFIVQYTVTGYPRWLERAVPAAGDAVRDLHDIAKHYGPDAAVWRYDPVLTTDSTSPDWHVENLRRLSGELAGSVSEVVVSFAHSYRKTGRNLSRACAQSGQGWTDPPDAEKRDLMGRLREVAGQAGLSFSICAQPDLSDGVASPAQCIDTDRLNRVAVRFGHRAVAAPVSGPRQGCYCAQSRDIGAYDTCSHGCVYCYAVKDPRAARENQRNQDPRARNLDPRSSGSPE